MKKIFLLFAMTGWVIHSQGQSFNSKSNAISLDYSDPKKNFATTLPKITWQTPYNETVFLKEGKISVEITVESKTPLKNIQLTVVDQASQEVKGTIAIPVTEETKFLVKVAK